MVETVMEASPPASELLGRWAHRQTDVAAAIARIRPGQRILIGSGAAEPARLVQGLCDHGPHLEQNEIVHLMTLGPAPYVAPEMAARFRHLAFFIGENVREAVHQGRADFVPIFLSEIPALLRSPQMPIDVALIQVSPPDRFGFVSLGVSVDIVRAAVERAELVLAEVNPHMPRTHGDSHLHIDDLDALVLVDDELPELPGATLDDVDRELGRLVATLVPDGATLQLGIGRTPDAVLAALQHHHDLGIHSEMFSDGVMKLAEAGVITGKRKKLLPGKLVTSFVMGSRELYRWVHDNPQVEMRPSDFTNDPFVIARHDHFVSINSALTIDLTGQVAADSLGEKLHSGIGGQVDFVRGAARSPGGRAIIALRSTAKEGRFSRIAAELRAGTGVVTSRGDVHHVVTEHGIADLHGKTLRQRALALIDVAHPDFRGELLAVAKQRRFVVLDQQASRPEPSLAQTVETLRDHERILVRAAHTSDEAGLTEFFYRLSAQSTYLRFFHQRRHFGHADMATMVGTQPDTSAAVVGTTLDGEILGLGRYDREPVGGLAEVAFVVRDDHQGRGLGAVLLRRLADTARAHGLEGFVADVLQGNSSMLRVFAGSGLTMVTTSSEGVDRVTLRWPAKAASAGLPVA